MITVAIGCTGSGKTEIIRRLVGRNAGAYQVVLVHDANSQWTGPLLKRAGIQNGDGSAFEPSCLATVEQFRQGQHKRLTRFPLLLRKELPQLAALAMSYHQRKECESRPADVALVLDELRLCCTTQGFGDGPEGNWARLLVGHRHYGVHVLACTQSPTIVDPNVCGNASELYLCAMQKRSDFEWVRETCGDEFADAVQKLPRAWPLACVRWRPMCNPEVIPIENL